VDERWIALAEVARPHGVNGELRLKVYNLDSDVLLRKPRVRLVMPNGDMRVIELRSTRKVPNGILVRIDGVGDRDAADAMRGARFEVQRDGLKPADEDEFYHCDLVGLRVTLAGEDYGRVQHVTVYPTCDVLVVVRDSGGKIEVPIHGKYVADIDVAAGNIKLDTVDGLDA
jgi:16S rRNA processing protein RimM